MLRDLGPSNHTINQLYDYDYPDLRVTDARSEGSLIGDWRYEGSQQLVGVGNFDEQAVGLEVLMQR